VNGKIYAIGGILPRTVEEYDPVSDTWTARASMLTDRYDLTAAAVNGKVYAIGGSDDTNDPESLALNSVEEYDPVGNTWTTFYSMPTARCGLAAAAVNSRVYALGGIDGSLGSMAINEELDLGLRTLFAHKKN